MAKRKFPLQWMVLIIVGLGALVFWPSPDIIKSLSTGNWPSPFSSPQNFCQFFERVAGQGPLASWFNGWFNPGAAGINEAGGLAGTQNAYHTAGPDKFQAGHGNGAGSGSGAGSGGGTGTSSGKGSGNAVGNANQTGAGLNSNSSQPPSNLSAATGIYPTAPSANNNANGGNNNNGNASGSDNGSDNSGSNDQTQSSDNNSGSNSGSNGSPDNNNSGNNPSNGSGSNPVGGGSSSGGSAGGYNGPGAGNGAGDNSGFSPCVAGCYPGCIPGCDPECTPPSCGLGVNPNNLPTANPILSDGDASQNVAVQDQANQRLTELLASRAALVAPVQQQAQASKYQTIDPAGMPDQPSPAQVPADVQAKIQAHQLNLH